MLFINSAFNVSVLFNFQFLQVLFEFQFEETLGQVETSFFSCVEPKCIKYGAVTFESNCQKTNWGDNLKRQWLSLEVAPKDSNVALISLPNIIANSKSKLMRN